MGCGNCGSGAGGKPSGCKSNGGCTTGGCNRMNVYDWLSALPLADSARPYPIVEVSFNKGSRKDFYKNAGGYIPEKGDWIAVEGVNGFDIGQVNLTGELVKLQMKKYGVAEQEVAKKILRRSTEDDLKVYYTNKEKEPDYLTRARAIARSLKLEMKLCEIELQADGKKGTFFYTADQRVDFRELIKMYASDFRMKVEMRQIGARQESGKVGGIGSCGRELCCATWLTDFKSVNTTAARYQNLSINQTKLSGQCGRLKCCLNYELDTYMDALRVFPDHAETIGTIRGNATLQKKDIFRNLMWYSYSDSSKQYPLSITRVKEILLVNRQGEKVEDLQPVELEIKTKANEQADAGFINDVGQITLKALEKGNRKKKQSGNNNAAGRAPGQRQSAKPSSAEGQPADSRQPQVPQQRPNRDRPRNDQRAAAPESKPGDNAPAQRPQHSRQRPPRQGGDQRNDRRGGNDRGRQATGDASAQDKPVE